MGYLNQLKLEASCTRTLNGAKSYASSGQACLDFFAVAGGMRYRKADDQIRLFDRAYIETPDLAMKLLFHLRDIRGGMGERKLFRTLLRHVATSWPESARRNVTYIAEFGRWDDLLWLMDTPVWPEAAVTIMDQLAKDQEALSRRQAGEEGAPISLLAKWLPSDNASSPRTRMKAKKLMKALGLSRKDYRRLLTSLRACLGLAECQLTGNRIEKINYEALPGQAMLKYHQAFVRRDGSRFADYLAAVRDGQKKMHTETLFPYEILRPFFIKDDWHTGIKDEVGGMEVLDLLWDQLPGTVAHANAISLVDTSGSMYWSWGPLVPALISQAMGLYCADRCQGIFHNHLITFESSPHLVEVHGETLRDKLKYLSTLPWGGSTNLEAVFKLLLETAVKWQAKQEEMPQVIYIFSDMEFDSCMENADKTVYDQAKERFEASGYQMPAVVFQNVNSWHMQTPVRGRTKGTALASGASTASMGQKFDGNITPMDHMLRVLNSGRYAMIHA